MPEERPPHLWIPENRITTDRFVPSGFPPPFSRDDYSEHGQRLIGTYRETERTLSARKDADLASDLIVQVITPEGVSARSQRTKLAQLGFHLVAYSPKHTNHATGLISKPTFADLQRRLEAYAGEPGHPGRSSIAVLEGLAEVPVDEKIDPDFLGGDVNVREGCMITLFSRLGRIEKAAIARAIAQQLRLHGRDEADINEYVNGTVVVTASLTPEEMIEIGTEYVSVRSIVPNRELEITRAVAVGAIPRGLPIEPPAIPQSVAVIDSGINDGAELLRGLVPRRLPFLPPGAIRPEAEHGTFVASRIAYGDDLDRQLTAPPLRPACAVIDVPVVGCRADGAIVEPTEAQLISTLQSVVPQLAQEVRVFNLSLGPPARIATGSFAEMSKVVDYLARAHDVLFVVAAGNIKRPASVPPSHFAHETSRIQVPSDALLALTVGSYAKYTDTGALAAAREVSPFTRRGPGADDGLKPEVVAHGGNLLPNWTPTQRIATYGIHGDGAQLASDAGTSFAAPLVSQAAARLFATYPNATSNLVRALLCHFCAPVAVPDGTGCEPQHLRGLGEPQVDRALFSGANSAAYLYQGRLRDSTVQHVPFLIPQTLSAGRGRRALQVKVTVTYDPPVNPDNAAEYSQARIVVQLYKKMEVGFRKVQLGQGEDDASQAWNPMVHFEPTFTSGYQPGEWEVRLRLMTRGDVPDDFEQTYSLIVEVVDGLSERDVRSDILAEAGGTYASVILRTAA